MKQRSPSSKIFIEGPVTFGEYFHPGLKKHVYLFGDIHTSDIKCSSKTDRLPFHSLVKKMIRAKSSSKIDVFVESSFMTAERQEKPESEDFVLSSFRKTFSPCLRYSKEGCKKLYPNARFHYTDVRDFFPSDVITAIYNIDTPHPVLFGVLRYQYKDIANIIYDTNHRPEEVMELMKIKKQFDSIPDESLRNLISEYFQTRFNVFRVSEETIEKIFANLESIKDNPESLSPAELFNLLEGQYDNIVKMIALYFDYYTICRLLRKFSDGTDIKKCIIYEGENHAEEHRNLLSILGFELLNISVSLDQSPGSENFQCIRLPNLNSFLGRRLSIRNSLNPVYGPIPKTVGILTLSKNPIKRGLHRIIRLSDKGTYETLE